MLLRGATAGGYPWITVPLSPRMASGAFSSEQITARRPGPLAANSIAAWTLGSIDPAPKHPSST